MRVFCLLLLSTLACAARQPTMEHVMPHPELRRALAARGARELVSVLGVELALHDSDPSGSKPSIFCLHAIGHGGSDFAAFEEAFAPSYRILTLDWPGQGASGVDSHPADAQRYHELFSALVERLSLKRLILLGNSIGGSVAIRYAAAHPEDVRAILLSNSAGLDRNPGGFLPKLFIGQVERNMRRGAAGDPAFLRWFRDYYAKILITPAAAAQRAAIVANGYEVAPVLMQAWHSFARADSDVRMLARGLSMPVFVAWARHDRAIRWSRNRAAVEQIPGVEIEQFDAGHAPFLETPDAFNRSASAFLRKHQL
ncbi:MAG: hsaD [Myxococcaceae bacterium]|nr:hsaD [Myxococcaceae bacterium]